MKLVQVPVLKPTAANFDKEAVRWSLSWHPDDRCVRFTREAILACAPPTSGVYGLFNFDCQVFIGEAANIQEALLRHQSESDFQSEHLQPTGFTFELCAAELRKSRMDDLIARFHPVLQSEGTVTETRPPSDSPMVSEMRVGGRELETYADHQEFPVHEREKHPKHRRLFHFKWTQSAMLAAILVVSAVVIFYLGVSANKNIQKRVNAASEKPLARISITQPSASGGAGIELRSQNGSSIDPAGGRANRSAAATPANSEVHASSSTPNGALRLGAKNASAEDGAGIRPLLEPVKASPIAHHTESADLSKKWSVQISAAPAKDIAGTLVQRLKANGYDGYVVQAEVKGQPYYRVRVGPFTTREEAESVRESLARQEGYRDAYLTGD
jgi:cell division septation protein DedD